MHDVVCFVYVVSNSEDSMNALSVDARKMPIILLLDFFRRLPHEWCNKRSINGVVSKNEERTKGWSVLGVSDAIYQVLDFKHVTCTCKYWEGTGLPCGHDIMVLKHLKKN
uniref:SWIM-type domain-containing protein n=1 Tax=Lactuca sativa TaxID=4236 RepID=A0A9R1VTE2_LACSA|nr:hypothetical protein LSAT_V11C400191550 [Lactuca sativa]